MVEQLLQICVSLAAIALLSVIAWITFPNRFKITEQTVVAALDRTLTGDRLISLLLSEDDRTALAKTDSNTVYAVRLMGRDISIRPLRAEKALVNATSLTLEFDDFTMPSLTLEYSAEDAKRALNWLKEAGIQLDIKG